MLVADGCQGSDNIALRGRRRLFEHAAFVSCLAALRCLLEQCFICVLSSSPARAAAGGGRAPCTPGPGLCPWEPRFDAIVLEKLGVHAVVMLNQTNFE